MKRCHIKPKDGLIVRDPAAAGEPLPKDGKEVTWNSYWQRRQNDGAITVTVAGSKAAKKSKE